MMEIKNLKKSSDRIKKAIKDKEKIIICGDSDLDGTAAVIVLKESIKSLGGKIFAIHFPNRETEGYGITETTLKLFEKETPALLIALDFGIGNFDQVKLAKKMGFDIMIIDHHEILGKIPKADIVVDPKQKGDKYPFKEFAAAGLAFKLSEKLFDNKIPSVLRRSFLELVALATVADMMPREEDNKLFIDEGLPCLEDSYRPGIKVFWQTDEIKECPDYNHKIFQIISVLNVRDVKNGLPASYRLLTVTSEEKAQEMIGVFLEKTRQRKEKINLSVEEIEKDIFGKDELIIFEGSAELDYTLISSIASILCNRYKKPTFIFKKLGEVSQGTVRTPRGVDSVALMRKCSDLLLTYGGHPLASGFRIKNENLEKFKERLTDEFLRSKNEGER